MRVKISEYLKVNDNKLTALLQSEVLDGAILDECLMEVEFSNDEWWCDLYLEILQQVLQFMNNQLRTTTVSITNYGKS